ncbi:MAG: sulfite reductase subunit alpha, partial [Bradyrhizobium sp.]|uniref:(Fe-S)-binding protein n=1 Tax=Bradyrhizobium sp. TaxID=376 RepID=UPI001D1C7FFF
MNQITPPPRIEIIPANAPFSDAQRSWLNGFFASLLTTEIAVPLSAEQGAALLPGAAGDGDDGEAPWHDQTLPIAERMKLADGRPLRRRMMAAMAQQDCGQCGYNCHDYSEAIAGRSEARLNLCVPGGKETARMLKALHEELDKAPATASSPASVPAVAVTTTIAEPGRSRDNPIEATFLSRRLLNKQGSEKETWHIEFDLAGAGLDYVVGDSFGIFAKNELGLVDQIIAMLGAAHNTPVRERTLREVLHEDVSLGAAPDSLYELFSYVSGGK